MKLYSLVKLLAKQKYFKTMNLDRSRYTIGSPDTGKHILYPLLNLHYKKNIVVIVSNQNIAQETYETIKYYTNKEVILCSENTNLSYEPNQLSNELASEKLKSIAEINKKSKSEKIIILSCQSAVQKTINKKELSNHTIDLSVNLDIDIIELIEKLIQTGYTSTNIVNNIGQFTKRGGVVDVFPINYGEALRIEFDANQIQSLRTFDITTQRTVKPINEISLYPAKEWIFSEDTIQANKKHLYKKLLNEMPEILGPSFSTSTILDHINNDFLLVIDEPAEIINQINENEVNTIHAMQQSNFLKKHKIKIASPNISLKEYNKITSQFKNQIYLDRWALEGKNKKRIPIHEQDIFFESMDEFVQKMLAKSFSNETTIIISQQAQRLAEIFHEHDYELKVRTTLESELSIEKINLIQGALNEGYLIETEKEIINVFTDKEIFGVKKVRRLSQKKLINIIETFKEGDFVVHEDYGIARYQGLVKRRVDNKNEEYIYLQFAENDKLYLPTINTKKITKYIASSSFAPKLSLLNSNRWIKIKKKAYNSIDVLANQLIYIYSSRKKVKGHKFSKDNEWQKNLESSFEYEETDDQKKAISDVKKDMESIVPMDRLICGDVGFGKTEVALRAAFKAIQDGFQVAILVPTTVLAEQHLRTFSQRLAAFPVTIESLSRLKKIQEVKEVIEKVKNNQIDILIGTHKMLSSDLDFNNLGLIIIDEEQKFGVIHKEKLKKFKLSVDCLTMSATPIPRTMYMGIGGIKDLSLIETAPLGRRGIQTFVSEYSEIQIERAITNELIRNGQIYFVHNKVNSIEQKKEELHKIIPKAKITVAHGQMPENHLSEVMNQFYNKEFDILLCTTIIESGIDNPNVNTIIVDDADNFGLSQLYQLRGRIGRGVNQGYAYLFHKKNKQLTADARKRLSTIFDANNLGAGFQIALKDLEIRGAGNILGATQSGHIAAIGLELYTQMLSEAISKKQKQEVENNVIFTQIKLDFEFNAFIPDNYIQRNEIKIDIYKKLNLCNNNEDLNHLSDEIKDRYGKPPVEMINLLTKQSIIINARHNKIEYIEVSNNTLIIRGLEKINHRNLAMRIKDKVILQGNKKIVFEFIYDNNKKLSKMKEIVTNFK